MLWETFCLWKHDISQQKLCHDSSLLNSAAVKGTNEILTFYFVSLSNWQVRDRFWLFCVGRGETQ